MRVFIFIFLISAASIAVFPGTIETALSGDAGSFPELLLMYRQKKLSVSVILKTGEKFPWNLSGGINTSFLAAGHIEDSGIASEIRNPGFKSVSRLTERTFYSADLRNSSETRNGIIITPFKNRLMLGWERRKKINSAVLWGAPVNNDNWNLEIIISGGILGQSPADNSWYPEKTEFPETLFGIISGRSSYENRIIKTGITLMFSAGDFLLPGYLASFSFHSSFKAIRIRGRAVISDSNFRNADGEKIRDNNGFYIDFRYRPSEGFNCALNYETGFKNDLYLPDARDRLSAAGGWYFKNWNFYFQGNMHNLIFPGNFKTDSLLEYLKGEIQLYRGMMFFQSSIKFSSGNTFVLSMEGQVPAGSRLLIKTDFSVSGKNTDKILYSAGLNITASLKNNKIIISADWNKIPQTGKNIKVQLRWIYNLNN